MLYSRMTREHRNHLTSSPSHTRMDIRQGFLESRDTLLTIQGWTRTVGKWPVNR